MSGEERSAGASATTRLYPLGPTWMSTLFYGGLLAWAVVLLVLARGWNWQDKLFPVVFTGLAIVLIGMQLLLIHFRDRLSWLVPNTSQTGSDEMNIEQDTDTEGRVGRARERYELIMIGWVIALPVLLQVIGFLYTIPIYTFAFIWYFLRDARTAVIASAFALALIYVLFVQVLGIRLPEGLLFA